MQAFAEADEPSRLFQYYLLDTTGFESNVFTAIIPGVNDANVQLTVTGGNCGLPTVGAVRVVLEPKPGLPTDPTDPAPSSMFSPTFPRCSSSQRELPAGCVAFARGDNRSNRIQKPKSFNNIHCSWPVQLALPLPGRYFAL